MNRTRLESFWVCAPVVGTTSGTTLASSIALQRALLLPILLRRMESGAAGAKMVIPCRQLMWQVALLKVYDVGDVLGAARQVHVHYLGGGVLPGYT